nr:hypothetical protein DGKKSRWO_DGKKSRWO_CDS_0175 [uncultured phage]
MCNLVNRENTHTSMGLRCMGVTLSPKMKGKEEHCV